MRTCLVCGKLKQVQAELTIRIGEKEKIASLCPECYADKMKNTAVRMLIMNQLPDEWKELFV
jgi:NMD protein affecting ribosome stability and mRNA decay